MPSRRIERVNELLRAEISELIAREIKDPRVSGMISITEVDTAPDLRYAKVYVSVMVANEQERAKVFNTLKHAAGFFRKELGERLTMRRTPELAFILDTSIERGDRIMRLLRDLEAGNEKKSVSGEQDDASSGT